MNIEIRENQYLPNGFGSSASTYYYIYDPEAKMYWHHKDKKWRRKTLMEATTYWFLDRKKAELELTNLQAEIPLEL